MTNFKWCVWLVPGEGHEWNSLTNWFPAHMTVKSHLERDEAERDLEISKLQASVLL